MIRAILLLAVVVAGLMAAADGYALYGGYRDLEDGAAQTQAAARILGDDPLRWSAEAVQEARARLAGAERSIARGRRRVDSDPLLSAAQPLPGAGDQVATVRDLADALAEARAAAADVTDLAGLYVQAVRTADPRPLVIRGVQLLDDASARLQHAGSVLRADQERSLLPQIAGQLDRARSDIDQAQREVTRARDAARALRVVSVPPTLTG